MGKSDHVVLEMVLQDWEVLACKEDYKNGRLNHADKFCRVKKILWKGLTEGMRVQEKYETFLKKYNEGVQKYVPI